MSHIRRYFVDALLKYIKSPEATLPSHGIAYCNKLFDIEKSLDDLPSEKRKLERLNHEKPVLDAFWLWIEKSINTVLPKSKLSDAMKYALNQKEELMNYLKDGSCVIFNSLAENSIRPFKLCRKNWLLSGSPKGAKASAAVYALLKLLRRMALILTNISITYSRSYRDVDLQLKLTTD